MVGQGEGYVIHTQTEHMRIRGSELFPHQLW